MRRRSILTTSLVLFLVVASVSAQEKPKRPAKLVNPPVSYGTPTASGSILAEGKFTDASATYQILEEKGGLLKLTDGTRTGWVLKIKVKPMEQIDEAPPVPESNEAGVVRSIAQDPLLGKKVFLKLSAKGKIERSVLNAHSLPPSAIITQVEGDWLWIGIAWVRRTDVMKLDEAFAHFSVELQRTSSSKALDGRAQCWQLKGEQEYANRDFVTANRLQLDHPSEWSNEGARKMEYDLQGAIADLDAKIEKEPRDAISYYHRGLAKNKLKNFVGAVADFNASIEINPNYAMAYLDRGNSKSQLSELRDAVDDYDKAIALSPKLALAFRNRANAKDDMHDFVGFTNDIEEAIRIDPGYADAYNDRGVSKSNRNDHVGAIADFDLAIRFAPTLAILYRNRALSKEALNRYPEAILDYEEAIRLEPNNAKTYLNLGNAKLALKQFSSAAVNFDQAIRIDPNLASAYRNRGLARHAIGKYGEALEDYDRAIRIQPNDAWYYNSRGWTKLCLSQFEPALADFNESIRLDPTMSLAISNKSFLLSTCPMESIRNGDQAKKLAIRCLEMAPRDPFAMNALACASALLEEYSAAIEWEKKALEDVDYRNNDDLDGGLQAIDRIQKWESKTLWLIPEGK